MSLNAQHIPEAIAAASHWLCRSQPVIKGEISCLKPLPSSWSVLWLLGLVTSYTMGGLIHALLVIAIVVILIRVIQGRRL